MKKILITRRLIRESEEKASKLFEANFNANDELYSQKKIIEMSQGYDGILSSLTEKLDKDDVLFSTTKPLLSRLFRYSVSSFSVQKESRFCNSFRFLPFRPDSFNTSNKTASESPMVLATSFEKLILESDI